MELTAGAADFCFVVQVDDIAYIAVAHGHVPSKMTVGDPIEIRIKDDNLFVKAERKRYYNEDEIEGRIRVRKRMAGETKLPSCALAVTLH